MAAHWGPIVSILLLARLTHVISSTDDGECRNVSPDRDCMHWAKSGECKSNPGFMEENCSVSCGTCAILKERKSAEQKELKDKAEAAARIQEEALREKDEKMAMAMAERRKLETAMQKMMDWTRGKVPQIRNFSEFPEEHSECRVQPAPKGLKKEDFELAYAGTHYSGAFFGAPKIPVKIVREESTRNWRAQWEKRELLKATGLISLIHSTHIFASISRRTEEPI